MPRDVRSTGTNFTNSDCIDDEEAAGVPVDDDEDDEEEEEEEEDEDDDIVQTLNSTNVRVRVIKVNV